MFAAWRVAVVLSARNLTGPAFASFIANANAAESSAERMKRAVTGVRTVAAVGFAAAGVALSAFVAHGLNEAGKFELAMKNVQIATGATGQTLKDLQGMAITLSGKTSQDVTQIASEMAMAGRAGLTAGQIKQMMPQLAAYADVQMRSHGTDPVQAVNYAVQAAHMLGAYGRHETKFEGKKMTDLQAMLEWMNRLSFTQPEEMRKVITQMGYFAPQGTALGMNIQDIMDSLVVMGQTGYLRGKGGTGLAQIINGALNTVEISGHKQSNKTKALRGLGLIDPNGRPVYVDRTGHLLWGEMVAHLKKVAEHTKPSALHEMFTAAFNVNGGRFADVMFSPGREKQRLIARQKMSQMASIEDMQNQYLGQFLVSLNTLRTNITTATAALFLPLAQRLTPWIRSLAAQVMTFAQYVFQHPDLGLKISIGLIAGAALSFGTAAAFAVIQIANLNRAIWLLAGAARAATVAEDAQAVATVAQGASGAGKFGKFLKWIVGGELIAPVASKAWGGISGAAGWLKTALLGDVFRGANGGKVINSRGLLGIGPKLLEVGEWFGRLVPTLTRVLPWVARLGLVIGEVGVRFIPVIGWVLLVIQALAYFHKNPAAVGEWVGKIIGWVVFKLMPGILNGITTWSVKIWDAFGTMLQGLWNMIASFLGEVVNIARDYATGGVAGVIRGLAARHSAQLKGVATGTAHGIGAFIQGAKNDFGKFGKSFSQSYQQQSIEANTPASFSHMQFNGKQALSPGQAFDQSLHGDINYTITITDSKNPRETARHVVKEINKRTPGAQRLGGSSNTPWLPTLPGLSPQGV